MEFPKIKRTVKSFLLDESGSVTKKSILAVGFVAVLAGAQVVSADEIHCRFITTCDAGLVGGPVIREFTVDAACPDTSGGDDCYVRYDNPPAYVDVSHTSSSGGDTEYATGTISFSDLNIHDNSLVMSESGSQLLATHGHAFSHTNECDLQFKVMGHQDEGDSWNSGWHTLTCSDDCTSGGEPSGDCDVRLGCDVDDPSKLDEGSTRPFCTQRDT